MGAAMAHRLIDVGHELTVWNRTTDKADALINLGADRADTPRDLVHSVEVVVDMLLNDEAVRSLYSSNEGILVADCSDKLFIEMSTVKPETIIDIASKIEQAGGLFVECPVAGTVGPAREGQLMGLAAASEKNFIRQSRCWKIYADVSSVSGIPVQVPI